MRLTLSALSVLMLAACASQGPTASDPLSLPVNSTASQQQQQQVADAIRRTAAAKETINVDKTPVTSLAGSSDLWNRIRGGFQIPDLQSDLVDMQVNWYAQRPDYVERMTTRSQKYLYHIVEELEQRHMPTELALLPLGSRTDRASARKSATRPSGPDRLRSSRTRRREPAGRDRGTPPECCA